MNKSSFFHYTVCLLLMLCITCFISCIKEDPASGLQEIYRSTLIGGVVDKNGTGLSNVSVTSSPGGHTTNTITDGSFSLPDLEAGKYVFRFHLVDYLDTVCDSIELGLADTQYLSEDIKLTFRYGAVRGMVSGFDPSEGAGVAVENQQISCRAGTDGSFLLNRIEPGNIKILASSPGKGCGTTDALVNADDTLSNVTIPIEQKGKTVYGQVVNDEGDLIQDAVISVMNGAIIANTDSNGVFIISDIPATSSISLMVYTGSDTVLVNGIYAGDADTVSIGTITIQKIQGSGTIRIIPSEIRVEHQDSTAVILVSVSLTGAIKIEKFKWDITGDYVYDTSTAAGRLAVLFRDLITGQDSTEAHVRVMAVSVDSIESDPADILIKVVVPDTSSDVQVPDPPVLIGPSVTNNPKPTWQWTSNNVGHMFRYRLDTLEFVEVQATSFTPQTDLSEGSHTLIVQERNNAGFWSKPASHTTIIDLTPPNAPVVQSASSKTNNPRPTWTWQSGGNGDCGIYRCKLNDSTMSGVSEITDLSYTPASDLSEGTHTLYAQERDSAGNWSGNGRFAVFIDTTPPVLVIDSPSVDQGTYNTSSSGIFMKGTATDPSGITTVTYELSGVDSGNGTASGKAVWFIQDIVLKEGITTIIVTAIDSVGNIGTDTLVAIYVPPINTGNKVIYLSAAAPDGGDGTSWATAFNDLTDALEVAEAGDEIWIAKGVYLKPDSRDSSYVINDAIKLFGGFVGNETSREQRNASINKSILSGDIGITQDPTDNLYTVVIVNGDALIEGVTIRDGHCEFFDSEKQGAGMRIASGSPVIINCTITNNHSFIRGGGIFSGPQSSLSVYNCVFTDNSTNIDSVNGAGFGGGVSIRYPQSTVEFHDCYFSNNTSALDCEGNDMKVNGCIFINNLAGSAIAFSCCSSNVEIYNSEFISNSDGAISTSHEELFPDYITISRCKFIGNISNSNSGGITIGNYAQNQVTAIITNCAFLNNKANGTEGHCGGGAIWTNNASPSIMNCLFSNNEAVLNGGAINTWGDEGCDTIRNCTFVSNKADGGGAFYTQVNANISNCIFWNNSAAGSPNQIQNDGILTISYSAVEGGNSGIVTDPNGLTNIGDYVIDSLPLFVSPTDPDGGDNTFFTTDDGLRLQPGSPCIDAGTTVGAPSTDIMGISRPQGNGVDMGAYEQ